MQKRWLLICLSIATMQFCFGQELSLYQSYLFIPELHNPAYNGAFPCTKIGLVAKRQWFGIAYAPTQEALSANIRIEQDKFRTHGIGLQLLHDRNGAYRATGGRISYAYHLMVQKAKGNRIALSLSAAAFNRTIDTEGFIANDLNDPQVQASTHSALRFDVAFGALYYTRNFTIGLSAYQLVASKSIADQSYRSAPLFILHSDCIITANERSSFTPGGRIVYERSQQSSGDIYLKYTYRQKLWLALMLRSFTNRFDNTANSTLLCLGYNYKRLTIGYSADIGLTSLQTQNYASHELHLAIQFCKKETSCKD